MIIKATARRLVGSQQTREPQEYADQVVAAERIVQLWRLSRPWAAQIEMGQNLRCSVIEAIDWFG